ncbi:hypothetical protein H072_6719 [Dactylellina haptotyla CBS 200.50]|uniref:Uncharacterized protein n=1 Tax=Dactylellina haptotyla (strain CBS 200.50) TaxID=1284197 RepID=S8AEE6_DACHA|nr:hypothetical protein H072_6719 [Dactylellina haptotyla CBS 200.50]
MPLGLIDLPADVKYLILINLPDCWSLLSLINASDSYNSVYRCLQDLVDNHVRLNDALKYRRESIFVGRYAQRLHHLNLPPDILRWAIERYLAAANSDAVFKNFPLKHSIHPELTWDKLKPILVRNHLLITKFSKFYACNEMARCNPFKNGAVGNKRPTLQEEERIIRATYRLWVFGLLMSKNKASPFENYSAVKVLNSWEFTGRLELQAVRDFLNIVLLERDAFIASVLISQNTGVINTFLMGHHRSYGFNPMALYKFPETMTHCVSQEWHNEPRFPSYPPPRDPRIGNRYDDAHVSIRGKRLYDYIDQHIESVIWETRYLKGQKQGLRLRYPDRKLKENLATGEGEKVPVYEGEWKPLVYHEGRVGTQKVVLGACMWDDWRLKSWGYEFVDFSGTTRDLKDIMQTNESDHDDDCFESIDLWISHAVRP